MGRVTPPLHMGPVLVGRLVLAPVVALALGGALTAQAQEAESGGVTAVLGVSHALELGRNIPLRTPEDGRRATVLTGLSFALTSETPVQLFSLESGTVLRLVQEEGDTSFDVDTPDLALRYRREGARARFEASATYASEDIEALRSLGSFLDDEGRLVLPDDYEDLTGTGRRDTYAVRASLVLGLDEPLGVTFELGANGTLYRDASATLASDSRNVFANVALRAEFSPVLTGTARLGYARRDEDNADETRAITRSAGLGLSYAVSPRTTVDASFDQTWTEETTLIAGFDTTETSAARLGLGYDMPNGAAALSLDWLRDADGDTRLTLMGRRTLELPRGGLEARLGLARPENGDLVLLGGLDWRHSLPTGELTARLDRALSLDSEDETRITTSASAGLRYDINPVSSLGFEASYVHAEGTSVAPELEETDLSASYSHALTEDWRLESSVSYRVRDEEGVGRSDSPVLSISLGRDYAFRF